MMEITREQLGQKIELLRQKLEFAQKKQLEIVEELEKKMLIYDYIYNTLVDKYRVFKINSEDFVETGIENFIVKAGAEQFEVFKDVYENLIEKEGLEKYARFCTEYMQNKVYFVLLGYVFKK